MEPLHTVAILPDKSNGGGEIKQVMRLTTQ